MINCTRLLCAQKGFDDQIRYEKGKPADTNRPIVVWNSTKSCNLKCRHCYFDARPEKSENELTTRQAKLLIDDLADFGAPVLLFSGGEPLIRRDLFSLGGYAAAKGLRAVISTNGTLITKQAAKKIKAAGFAYVGISLDGLKTTNDKFRKTPGAFLKALQGIRNCVSCGVRVGLRFTINKYNYGDIAGIFDLAEKENIPRVCFYHLVYSGRGSAMIKDDLTKAQARKAIELIFEKTMKLCAKNSGREILTVDNHADAAYLYLYLKKRDIL